MILSHAASWPKSAAMPLRGHAHFNLGRDAGAIGIFQALAEYGATRPVCAGWPMSALRIDGKSAPRDAETNALIAGNARSLEAKQVSLHSLLTFGQGINHTY
jgi:hypothetical protein